MHISQVLGTEVRDVRMEQMNLLIPRQCRELKTRIGLELLHTGIPSGLESQALAQALKR